MKTISKLFGGAAILSAALFSSCQRTATIESDLVNPIEARDGSFAIVGNITDYQTRAHDDVWDAGDNIGVYAFEPGTNTVLKSFSNLKYNTLDASGVFKASNGGVVLQKTEKADIIAYYPYSSEVKGSTYAVNVSVQSDLKKLDLLWGKGAATADVNTAALPVKFNHKLALVQLRFTPKDGVALPKSIKATFKGALTSASFDLLTGKLTPGDAKGDLAFDAANNAINGIFVPGDIISGIEFIFDGNVVSYTFETPYTLAEDTKYTFSFSPFADGSAVVLNVEGSIEDWGKEVTFEDDIPYGEGETPDEPGTDDPDPDEPETPALSLAFPGSDFETEPNVGSYGYKDAAIESGVGVDGSKGLHISATTANTKNNYIFSTPTTTAEAGKAYNTVTFKLKGSSQKSLAFLVFDSTGETHSFNLGDVTGDLTMTESGTGSTSPQYIGTINTNGQWVTITLNLGGLVLNTSGSGNTFALKDGKQADYDLIVDNIELK